MKFKNIQIPLILAFFIFFASSSVRAAEKYQGEELRDFDIGPVQFKEWEKGPNGEALLHGQFIGGDLDTKNYTLTLPKSNEECFLFARDGDWYRKVDRDTFLKKCKKEYWLVIFTKNTNIIRHASQFETPLTLQSSFAQDEEKLPSVKLVAYWERMRIEALSVYKISGDQVYWASIYNSSPPSSKDSELANKYKVLFQGIIDIRVKLKQETDQQKLSLLEQERLKLSSEADEITVSINDKELLTVILLDDKTYAFKKFQRSDGGWSIIGANGTLILNEKTVIHVPEAKEEKRFVLKDFVRMRVKPVTQEYFRKYANKKSWAVFYDSETKNILRIIEVVPELQQVIK